MSCDPNNLHKPYLILRVIPGGLMSCRRVWIASEAQRLAWIYTFEAISVTGPSVYCTEAACEELYCSCDTCMQPLGLIDATSLERYCARMTRMTRQLALTFVPRVKAHICGMSQLEYQMECIAGCVCDFLISIGFGPGDITTPEKGRVFVFGFPVVFEAPAPAACRAVKRALSLFNRSSEFVLLMAMMDKSVIMTVCDEAQVFTIESVATLDRHTDHIQALITKASQKIEMDGILKRLRRYCSLVFRTIDRNNQRWSGRRLQRLFLEAELENEGDSLSLDVMTAFNKQSTHVCEMDQVYSKTRELTC